ncbi:twin-arginine translocase TatA/TatE family subunit [Paenibacillus sp. PAMC21692]|uniref:twin-arginine translocase TatA/TatE family subunit n=1 Tax=Paenibacillus sp. PAMC21692 TaxID=2762320 RepID=UPI00164CFB1F|nr:twin-arginine translocase TatA/TatE family subunit [Paenibacillus sp. PAMC21692]QNK60329.1 twin-arginine translocase TatA/TatE family subunit [Paenibacillus sp. PAMC21692]
MAGIGTTGIILLVLVALLLFGPNKLPELGRAFGRTLREFKRGTNDLMDDSKDKQHSEDRMGSASIASHQETTRQVKE